MVDMVEEDYHPIYIPLKETQTANAEASNPPSASGMDVFSLLV